MTEKRMPSQGGRAWGRSAARRLGQQAGVLKGGGATTDKPLHVRVAEALGCKVEFGLSRYSQGWPEAWRCGCEDETLHGWESQATGAGTLNRFDTDWSATGPLIERLGLSVDQRRDALRTKMEWEAAYLRGDLGLDMYEYGPTPLMAVCNLILALHVAGKLTK